MDFTNLPQLQKGYGGANGNKVCKLIDGEKYMVKIPGKATKNKNMSYANGPISEYIGCHIFKSI